MEAIGPELLEKIGLATSGWLVAFFVWKDRQKVMSDNKDLQEKTIKALIANTQAMTMLSVEARMQDNAQDRNAS